VKFGGISHDMNSVDFMADTMTLAVDAVVQILGSDDLKCKSEDQVADFVQSYLALNPGAAE